VSAAAGWGVRLGETREDLLERDPPRQPTPQSSIASETAHAGQPDVEVGSKDTPAADEQVVAYELAKKGLSLYVSNFPRSSPRSR
jgi:hypothetical protein